MGRGEGDSGRQATPYGTPLPRSSPRAILATYLRPRWARVIVSVWLIAFLGTFVAGFVASQVGNNRPIIWWTAVALIPTAIAVAIGLAVRTRAIVAEQRRYKFCRRCRYDISTLPADADGRTICPECGTVWRAANQST